MYGNYKRNIHNRIKPKFSNEEIIKFTHEEENIKKTNIENIQNDNNINLDLKESNEKININNNNIPKYNIFNRPDNYKSQKTNSGNFIIDNFLSQKRQNSNEDNELNKIFSPININDIKTENSPSKNNINNNIEEIKILNIDEKYFDKELSIKSEESNDEELKSKIQSQIDKIKEIKENQRKKLLQENDNDIYGYSANPNDLIRNIYNIINSNEDDDDSENEKNIEKWEKEKYMFGLNKNKKSLENDKFNDLNKKDNSNNYFKKIKDKIFIEDNIDKNKILYDINQKFNQEKEIRDLLIQRKNDNENEKKNIMKNQEVIKEKIDNYLKQYYRLKNMLIYFIEKEDSNYNININEEFEEDNYISS